MSHGPEPANGLNGEPHRFQINPIGCALALAGAIVMVIAVFLPAYQSDQPSPLGIQNNTLIQDGKNGWILLALAVVIVVGVYGSYATHRPNWVLPVLALLALGFSIYLGVHHPDLYQIAPDGTPDFANPIGSSPGIAIYVAAVGSVLAFIGAYVAARAGRPSPASTAVPSTPAPAEATRQCPDCAELILQAARVCKHCGFRFESAVDSIHSPTAAIVVEDRDGAEHPSSASVIRDLSSVRGGH